MLKKIELYISFYKLIICKNIKEREYKRIDNHIFVNAIGFANNLYASHLLSNLFS